VEREIFFKALLECRAFFHSGCSAVGQTSPSRLGAVLKCYKDAAQQMRGIWIIEIAELDAISRAEMSRIQGRFLIRTTDRYRPPYEHYVVEVPRAFPP
jgi:hypothetical protein